MGMHKCVHPKASYQQADPTLCLNAPILVFSAVMDSARISQAMDRIDRALVRIETQAALGGHGKDAGGDPNGNLAQRHEALKTSIQGTLAELDTLIERLER